MIANMEAMQVSVVSVTNIGGKVACRAYAVANEALIRIDVLFSVDSNASRSDVWNRARDEVLRYLDIA